MVVTFEKVVSISLRLSLVATMTLRLRGLHVLMMAKYMS
jgi:hypothetical protein